MEKFLFICIFYAGYLIHTYAISHCNFELLSSRPLDIGFGEYPKVNQYSLTCSNKSDLSIDNSQFKRTRFQQYHDYVILTITNSTIPILPTQPSTSSSLSAITSLVLQNSGIENISPGAFNGLSKLKTLDLSSNKLTKISKDTFDGLTKIRTLDLSKNNIQEIEEDSFSRLAPLNNLYLSENKLQVIHQHFTKGLTMDVFDVSDNPVEEFQDLGAKHIGRLTAKRLPFKSFPLNLTNTEIYDLEIQGGQLETIDFALLPRLTIFHASSNKISSIHNWDRMRGWSIDLNNNQLTEAEITPNVQLLNLSHNKIKQLRYTPSEDIRKVESLDLSFNEISEIPSGIFWNMTKLRRLNLNNNQISVLPENMFLNCPNLYYVNLDNNSLTGLESTSMNGASPDLSVHLAGNPINQTTVAKLKTLQWTIYV